MRKDILSAALGKELEGGCSHCLAQMRAGLGEFSMFSRPGSFFVHGLTLSSVEKLCSCSEYQISSSSNAFQSSDKISSALNGLIWAASPGTEHQSILVLQGS